MARGPEEEESGASPPPAEARKSAFQRKGSGEDEEEELRVFLHQRAFPEKPVMFGSNCKLDADNDYRFSNFYETGVPLGHRGRLYPTSEHAYQALKFPPDARGRFAVGGDLAGWEGLGLFYADPAEAEKKREYWGRKRMLGVVAKLCATQAAQAGLPPPAPLGPAERKCRLFLEILAAKFAGSPELAEALRRTRGRYLLEFARGAEKREASGKEPEQWGGLAVLGGDGQWRLHGENLMGKCLMAHRARAAREEG